MTKDQGRKTKGVNDPNNIRGRKLRHCQYQGEDGDGGNASVTMIDVEGEVGETTINGRRGIVWQ